VQELIFFGALIELIENGLIAPAIYTRSKKNVVEPNFSNLHEQVC
jgi:hypothetical protein